MPKPVDTYREGYEKGRKDGLGGGLGEMTMGMLRDDPGGYFAAGYRDGAAGKKFNPPSPEGPKTPPGKSTGSSATPLEKEWYGLCHSSSFIPTHVVDYYVAALKADGSHVAIVIGLNDFTFHTCPKCGDEGQFKVRFLGRLEHLDHWTGYMGTGSYIGFQISRIIHSGIRAGGSIKEDSDKKGERASGCIGGILAFLFVAMFRAALAVVLIPVHTVIALCQTGQTGADVATRVITLCLMAAGTVIGVYEIQKASRPQSPQVSPSQPSGFTQPALPNQQVFKSPKKGQKRKAGPPMPQVSGRKYVLLSGNIPGTASNWLTSAQQGVTQVRWLTPQPLEITAQPTNPPSGVTFYSNQIFTQDVQVEFTFNHQGFGKTSVGLWSVATNNWAASADLDTNDTNYLNFSGGGRGTEWKYSGSPYMNKWTTIQIRVVGSTALFSANNVLLENMPLIIRGGYRAALSVGSVAWKSGANDTSFRSISAQGN